MIEKFLNNKTLIIQMNLLLEHILLLKILIFKDLLIDLILMGLN